ncbi:MAG: DNA-binding protein [Oscillospiraceae bacterium]|nr:DNA-binding protein [Oscillospiraceae bacterium]
MKDLAIAQLYDVYAPLLSEKQRTVFEYYYDEDLSLSEIAEHTHTTRQGVRDLLKRSEEQLKGFEDSLHLSVKFAKLRTICANISDINLKTEIENILSNS